MLGASDQKLCVASRVGIAEPLPIAETFTFEDDEGNHLQEFATLDTMVRWWLLPPAGGLSPGGSTRRTAVVDVAHLTVALPRELGYGRGRLQLSSGLQGGGDAGGQEDGGVHG